MITIYRLLICAGYFTFSKNDMPFKMIHLLKEIEKILETQKNDAFFGCRYKLF